ncbi:UbiA prenyltransferase family-domain-containing protein [Haematococcus lacustris]
MLGLRALSRHVAHFAASAAAAPVPCTAQLGKLSLAFGRCSDTANCFRGLAQLGSAQRVSLLTNYKQLSKFKLSSLVVLTAGAGFVAGSGETISWSGLAWTAIGTFGAAACANTLNQLYEVANDRLMSRTCTRPLPTGRLTALHAAGFAACTGALGLGILLHQANPLTAALGATNIILYAGIYTPLKQLSPWNTWVGALVGALPPLMGWAAASGGQLEPGAVVLAAALFSWQLPHFMALAWLCKDDYVRGGFRMLSATDRSGRRTALVAARHCLYLLPMGALAVAAGMTTQAFAWEAAGLATVMAVPAAAFVSKPSQQTARKLFRSSLLYLPLLMLGLVIHRLPNDHSMSWPVLWSATLAGLEGGPADGFLPFMRTAGERSAAALQRVFGLSHAAMAELRCPSTVLSDAGDGVQVPGGRAVRAADPPSSTPSRVLRQLNDSPSGHGREGGRATGQGRVKGVGQGPLEDDVRSCAATAQTGNALGSPDSCHGPCTAQRNCQAEEGWAEVQQQPGHRLEPELRKWRWAPGSYQPAER